MTDVNYWLDLNYAPIIQKHVMLRVRRQAGAFDFLILNGVS